MLKIVGLIALALAIGIGGILAYAATKPDTFRVERKIGVKAPPEKIYPLIEDFSQWGAWSPYEKKDPAMKRSFEGPRSGKGAIYAWDGDSNIGAGRMEIVEASAPNRVRIKLDFFRPFAASNTAEFTLQPKGDTTDVTWAMYGPNLFLGKVMQVFLDFDRMVGTDFEAGLADLKRTAER